MTHRDTDITVVLPNLAGGGAERVALNLLRGFATRHIQVTLVVVSLTGPLTNQIPIGVKVIDLHTSRKKSFFSLVRYFRSERPRSVLAFYDFYCTPVILAARLAGIGKHRIVSTYHITPWHHESLMFSRTTAFFRRHVARVGARLGGPIVAVSIGVRDALSTYLRVPLNRIEVVYNPLVNDKLYRLSEQKCGHTWLNSDLPLLVASGRLVRQKDFATLLKALSQLPDDVRLIVLGEGPERENLLILAHKLGISERVEFLGFVANPYPYMRFADAVVVSSTVEGLSNVIVEALALGTPVVSTDCLSGPAELLDHGRRGALVPVGQPDKLASAIKQTLVDATNRTSAKEWAVKSFSADTIVEHYMKLLLVENVGQHKGVVSP